MRICMHLIWDFRLTVFYISVSIQLPDPSYCLLSINIAILLFGQLESAYVCIVSQHIERLIPVINLFHWRQTRLLLSTSPETRMDSFVDGSHMSAQTSSEFVPIPQHLALKWKGKKEEEEIVSLASRNNKSSFLRMSMGFVCLFVWVVCLLSSFPVS